jgi:hypothetical protein
MQVDAPLHENSTNTMPAGIHFNNKRLTEIRQNQKLEQILKPASMPERHVPECQSK